MAEIRHQQTQHQQTQHQKDRWLRELEQAIAIAQAPKLQQIVHYPYQLLFNQLNHRLNAFYPEGQPRFCWPVQGQTFLGDVMNLCLPEVVSREIYKKRYFEPGFCRLLIQLLQPGQVFVDVGAHMGFFTLLAAKLVGNEGMVHVFEPTPSTFQILQKNVAPYAHIHLNQLAVFSEETELTLNDFGAYLSCYNSVGSIKMDLDYADKIGVRSTAFQVKTCTLDRYFSQQSRQPDFIKIDAESAEVEILKGMTTLLSSVRPLIVLEVGDLHGATPSRDCVAFIAQFGYQPFELDPDRGSPSAYVPEKLYNDNLFFVPTEKLSCLENLT